MSDTFHLMAYIGRKKCGCVVVAMVDNRERMEKVGDDLKKWYERGLTIEHVPLEYAKQHLTECKCRGSDEITG